MDETCVLNPDQRCVGSEKVALLQKRVEDLEAWRNDTKEFHENFYNWQREQIVLNTRIDARLENIETDFKRVTSWMNNEQKKPAKFLDTIKSNIWWAIIAALLGYMLAQLGLPQ